MCRRTVLQGIVEVGQDAYTRRSWYDIDIDSLRRASECCCVHIGKVLVEGEVGLFRLQALVG